MARRKRHTVSAASAVGGCLWRVGSKYSEHHVIAIDSRNAEEVYLAIPEVSAQAMVDVDSTKVIELKRVDTCVYALPIDITHDVTGDGSQDGDA